MTDAKKRARTGERLRAGGKRAGEDVLPKRRRRNARAASGKLEMRRLLPSPEERTA